MNRVLATVAGLCLAIGSLAIALPAQAQMYWRLDAGWSKADTNLEVVQCPGCSPTRFDKVRDSYILGGGVGYRFNASVRGDATLAYRGRYGVDAGPGQLRADITSTTLMANGYYDFSSIGGWTPYIGAGVGWAHNKLDPLATPNGQITLPGGKKNNAAFALMAGVSVPASGLIFDIGYRYEDLGKIKSEPGLSTRTPLPGPGFTPGPFPYEGAEGKLTAHEVFVGVRF